jgi:hypothetical protein
MRPPISLKNMIGTVVIARIRAIDNEEMVLVKLHKVEAAGVWIEDQNFTDKLMLRCGIAASRTIPVVFVPFQGIDFILGSIDSLSLSERAFGVSDEDR